MKTYLVKQLVVYVDSYLVDAESEDDAINNIDEGNLIDTEYSHILEDEPITVTEFEDKTPEGVQNISIDNEKLKRWGKLIQSTWGENQIRGNNEYK